MEPEQLRVTFNLMKLRQIADAAIAKWHVDSGLPLPPNGYAGVVVADIWSFVQSALLAVAVSPQPDYSQMHEVIMNLACVPPSDVDEKSYRLGHRDARHNAAEKVLAFHGYDAIMSTVQPSVGAVSPSEEGAGLCPDCHGSGIDVDPDGVDRGHECRTCYGIGKWSPPSSVTAAPVPTELETLRAELAHEKQTGLMWFEACERWESLEQKLCPRDMDFEDYIAALKAEAASSVPRAALEGLIAEWRRVASYSQATDGGFELGLVNCADQLSALLQPSQTTTEPKP